MKVAMSLGKQRSSSLPRLLRLWLSAFVASNRKEGRTRSGHMVLASNGKK